MQNKIFRFNLDIKEKEFKTDFNLVQLDNTSMLVIKLFDEGNKVETTEGDRAEIAIDKNDNTFCVLPCNLYNNEVNCTLDSNALASPGWTNCEVRILNEGKILTSARFKIYIRENIVNNEKIKSTTEYKALEELINEAKIMQESLKKGETVIEDVNKIKNDLTEIKESILNKSKEINNNLAVADEKINLIKTYISKSETAINNLANNQNKIDSLSNLLKELEKIKLTLDELNASVNKANTKKTELDTSIENANREKTELDSSVENAKTQNTNLKNTITEAETAESSLETSTQKGISQQSNLEKTIADSVKKNKILSDTNTKSETLNGDLNVLSQDLTNKITDGGSLNSNLATSISDAGNAKKNLDGSINDAENTNTTLKATDTEAKKTEVLIKNLMNQLGKTKNEVEQIITSGDLSQYVTDPKLQEALKSYATKEDLSKIDVTSQLVDYAKKTEIPTKLSELQSDTNNRTVTDAEKNKLENIEDGAEKNKITSVNQKTGDVVLKISDLENDKNFKTEVEIQELINNSKKLKKEVVTSLPSTGKEDIIYLLKNKNDNNNFYTEYLWIGGKWEIIGDTKVDLTDYAKKSDIKTKLSEMVEDSTHRVVTDTEKTTWNNKVDKINGKSLSSNDFTNEDKGKVDAIPLNPKYTDTITRIAGKTGDITKKDLESLGIGGISEDEAAAISLKLIYTDYLFSDAKDLYNKLNLASGTNFSPTIKTTDNLVNSDVATKELINNKLAWGWALKSISFIDKMSGSSTAMNAVANSSTAMNALHTKAKNFNKNKTYKGLYIITKTSGANNSGYYAKTTDGVNRGLNDYQGLYTFTKQYKMAVIEMKPDYDSGDECYAYIIKGDQP